MSEVKGTLLTVILALLVFTAVSTALTTAIQRKANSVGNQISLIDTGEETPIAGGVA